MRPRRSRDRAWHHPLERVWCISIRSWLLLCSSQLRIRRLSVQQLVRYSPGRSLAQSPTASGSGVLLIWRTTQKRKAPICSRATVIPCALASSMIWVGSGPLGRSPSLGVGACALAASSACLRNSVGSMPCSVRMSSSSWLLYSVTFDLSFLSPTQRGSSPAIDYKQSAPPEPGVGQQLSRPLFTQRRRRRILRSSRLQSPPAQPRSSSYRTTLRPLWSPNRCVVDTFVARIRYERLRLATLLVPENFHAP